MSINTIMEEIMEQTSIISGSVSDVVSDVMAEVEKRFPEEPLPLCETYSIYYAATMDQPKRLAAALNNIKNAELRQFLVNVRFDEDNGQSLTPLTMAAMAGSIPFVKSLINNYKIDLERESNVIFDGLMVYGATALWVAAGMGHLQVVKLLVKGGAAVNHNTKAQSSPLRAACYEGRLDIVKYLIKHGANVNLGNSYNNTCIMIAAYKGHTLVVDALLKQGADPNEQALCGATALHYAAKCGHLDVCKLLLDRGARMQRNEFGLTPVMQAAEHAHEAIVEMFVQRPGLMTVEEIIDATELMGASFANSKDNYNVVKAHQYMVHAMELRYLDPAKLRRKKVMPPVPAYDNWFETENIPELNAIRLNHHSIHMEALTIRERILGRKYPDLTHCIVHRGAVMADQGRFAQCQILWEYAVDLKMMNDVPVDRDLLRFAQLFSQILRIENHALDLSTVLSILDKCAKEIENNKYKLAHPGPKDIPRLISDQSDQNIITALFLINIIGKLLPTVEKHHGEQLNTILRKLIKCDTRMCDGQTLLHLAVNGEKPVDDYTGDVCRFPCFRTALLLIHGGASVLALDCERNTPLHTLIKSTQDMRDPQEIRQVEDIINLFVDAGAHLDAVNTQGLAPVHLSNDANRILYLLLNYEHEHITLKCLASRCIVRQKLKYRGLIPQALESFIQMHSAENACA